MWNDELIGTCTKDVKNGNMLVLNSRVALEGGESKHIPMLDFHFPVSRANEEVALFIIRNLDVMGGYLLDSGKSYHFYGKSLLTDDELPVFLGRALQFCPIIDRAWVAHQLIERSCGLRISQKPDGGQVPVLVQDVEP